MNKIRIKTATGKIITRKADVENYIGENGRQLARATVQGYEQSLVVVERDYYGPIFGVER